VLDPHTDVSGPATMLLTGTLREVDAENGSESESLALDGSFMGKFIEIEKVEVNKAGRLAGKIWNIDTGKVTDLARIEQEVVPAEERAAFVEEFIEKVEQLMEEVGASAPERCFIDEMFLIVKKHLPKHIILTRGGMDGFFGRGKYNHMVVDKELFEKNPLSLFHEVCEYYKHSKHDTGGSIIGAMGNLLDNSPDNPYAGRIWMEKHKVKYQSLQEFRRKDEINYEFYYNENFCDYLIRAFTRQVFKEKYDELTQFIKAFGMYETAGDLIPEIVDMTRQAATYAIEPAMSMEDIGLVERYLMKTVRGLRDDGHHGHARGYLADENWIRNVSDRFSEMSKEFYKDVTGYQNKDYDTNTTRMVIRLISRGGDEDHRGRNEIEKFIKGKLLEHINADETRDSMSDEEKGEMVDCIFGNKIKFVEVRVDAKQQRLNTVIDLITDITMVECDRYGKRDGYQDKTAPPRDLKNKFLQLLKLSITNYDELIDGVDKMFDGTVNVMQIISKIFQGHTLEIRPIDWRILKEWKRRQDKILESV